jgi:polysaccharide biosynthesis transport protein
MRAPVTTDPIQQHSFAMSVDRPQINVGRSMIEAAPQPFIEKAPGSLSRFIRLIARQHTTILMVALLSVIATCVALHSITPFYTASAQLMIQRVAGSGTIPSADERLRTLHNEQELIASTPVLASALSMPSAHDMPSLRGSPDSLKLIKQRLHVDSGRGDDLISLSYDAIDPREGKQLVAAIVDAYVRFRSGLREAAAQGSAATILAEKQKAMDVLAKKRGELQQFSIEHGLAQGNEQVDAADSVMHELGIRLGQARVNLVAARSGYDQMQHDLVDDPHMRDQVAQLKNTDSALASGDDDAIARQICAFQTQLAGYGTKYMANYGPVQLLRSKIEDLKLERYSIIQQRWQTALRTEAELQTSFEQQQTVVAASEAGRQAFADRKADVEEAQKQVAAVDKQLKELESTSKLITTMVTVIEPANVSDAPTKPRAGIILLIAGAAGLALGCGVAGIRDRERQNRSIGSAKFFSSGLPLLARLPAVPRRQLAMNSWRDRMVDSAAEFAEACLKVDLALESIGSFSGGKTVSITSTDPREGKSTLASLLALTLAQNDKRVLLVDANLHSPAQRQIFGIDGEYGLGQLLEEEIESSFASYVHPGSDSRMDILLSGECTGEFADLLNSQRFTDLMAAMAAEYDYVLIDSPSLAMGVDARIIASACDTTIVLASESKINRKAMSKTHDSLTAVGANVLGVVLNGGMAAVMQQPALVSIDVSRHAPLPSPTPTPTPTPNPVPKPVSVQVTTLRMSQEEEQIQSVVAAPIHRAAETDAVDSADLPEQKVSEARGQWIWSYLLCLILLAGGWMAFQATWSVPHALTQSARFTASGRPTASELATSLRPEPVGILMAGAGLLVITLLAGFHAKPARQEIAIVVAGAVLAAFSFHGGMINTIWRTQQHDFMPSSVVQTILLFATLALSWSIVRRLYLAPATERNSLADIALATFASASAMSALMILLSQWETKGECLAVIAFSSCLSAMVAYWMAPLRSSLCFWLSPLAVAFFGYLCAGLNAQGIHVGMLMSLARPLPTDYASMGALGAMLGFWIARSAGQITLPKSLAVE